MKASERAAKELLRRRDIHTDKRGGRAIDEHAHVTKTTSLRNLKDAINTFREGR